MLFCPSRNLDDGLFSYFLQEFRQLNDNIHISTMLSLNMQIKKSLSDFDKDSFRLLFVILFDLACEFLNAILHI